MHSQPDTLTTQVGIFLSFFRIGESCIHIRCFLGYKSTEHYKIESGLIQSRVNSAGSKAAKQFLMY